MLCYLYPEPIYFLFSSEVPALLYYAHVPAIVFSLLAGFYIFWNDRHSLLNRLFLGISFFFSLWATINLITWTNIHSDIILFFWTFFSVALSFIAILCIYFIYVFLDKKDISIRIKIIFLTLLFPTIFIASTNLNLSGFDITNCDAFDFEWLPFKIYYSLLGALAMIWIFVLLIRRYRIVLPNFRKQIVLMGVGIELFLLSFFVMIFLASYFTQIGILQNSELEMYGLLGMVIFLVYISILMIRFKIFNTKLIIAQALVVIMIALVGSQFFFIQNNVNRVLTGINLVLITVFGLWLARSIKKEINQKEELEKLANSLEKANLRLQEIDRQKTDFLSIASHQLRTPLSIFKGYIELIQDGAYGKIPKKVFDILDEMDGSNEHLVKLVDEFLDITRIEQGRTKFSFDEQDINELVRGVVKELSNRAKNKGLKIIFKPIRGLKKIEIDEEKVRHVIFNFVDNAIKYSEKGAITVSIKKENNGVAIKVVDHGFGFGAEDKVSFYQKFYRGKNVEGTNVTGTGLGLYVCRKFIEAHKGHVWANSPGLGKGGEFGFWIPFGKKTSEDANKLLAESLK